MVKNQKPTKAEQEKADLEKLQKRMESMLPTKADIPAAISLRQTEELKVRIRELEAQLSQQMAEAQKKSNSDVETLIPEQTEIETKQTSESKISLVTKNIATVETKNQPATPFHEKAKQLGLWAAGIFTIIGLAFFSYSAYTLFFIQQGQAAIEDRVLLPITILMFVASAISFFLIRGNRFILGIWLLVSANLIIPSILSVLVLRNIYPVVLTYLITLTALLAFLIFPRTSRWQVLTAAATTILIIIGIEIWNPAFRGVTANLTNFTFVMIVLASVGFMVFFIRQANAGSITTKLTTTFVAVAVLSMGIVTYQGNRSLSNSLTSEIIDSQAQLAASQSSQIGQAINSQYDKLKSLATVKTIQTGTESANQDEARPTDVLEIEKLSLAWRDAVKANNTADPLVIKVLYNPLSTQLRKFQKTFPENVEILLTDDKGFTIAATNLSPNYYQADTLWWRTARTSGQYIGQPILNPNTNSIALDMSIPVYSYTDGAFEGVLRTTVNFNVLTDLLVQAANGQTGYSLIYLPNDQFIKLQRTENGTYSLVQDFASTDLQNYLKSPDSNQQLSLDGKAVLAKFAPVKSYSSVLPGEAKTALDSLGWQAGVIQEKSEALQPVTTQTRNNFTLAVFIIVLVLAISYFLAGFITNPIIRLTAVANQFASGDLSAVAKVETRDEIGTLATTFNRMTSQLQDTLQNLEKRVADRTQDLELAAEVGRTITEKVENTSVMLTEAVEMIRSNFNLYYTQVYLLDPTGQTINLRAGTGDVGRELLSRGHLLFVGSTSLNGRAISEKKPIIVANTEKNESFLPNPLLPKTRSEMAIPLLLGNKVLGVLDMQSETPNALNEENVASFQVLASQLSVAIQNASLLSQSEESRKQMEENFLRTTSTNWQDFLNGTDRGEKIGYVFDQIEVKPIEPKSQPKSENILNIPISVIGAEVGSIQVSQDNREWTSSEAEIIQSTADQLAQHIENLRLLSQAEKYRQEAEQTTRRLTRESWEDFVQTRNVLSESYSFSPNEVKGKNEEIHMESSSTLSLPLNVRDEAIGELMIHTENVDRESMNEIFSAVVLQLGEHIENLRLLETTEFELGERKKAQSALDKRAEQLVTLNRVMEIANSSLDLQYILQTATDEFRALMQAFSAGVLMLDEKGETLTLTTESYSDPSMPKLAGRAMPIAANPATDKSIKSGNTVLVPNAQTDPILAPIHAIMKQRNIQSVLVTPLFSRNKIIGVFSVDTNDPERHFDDNDVTLIETLAKQLAGAIESIQLFDETRRRAANLSTVAAVSTTTSTMLNPAELLQTVVDITKERFNLYHAHIYLSDISLENLLLAAGAGDIGRQMVETSHAIQINTERSLVARAAREKRTVVINNVQQEEGFLPNALLPDTIAEMAVPMVVGEMLLGVFDVQSDKASGFSSEDADIYNTLASQVAIALQNARLYVEQAATVTQLRELDKLKSSFLANMSHELRTPLNSILGFTDVILEELDGPLTANMDNDLKLIQKNGKHLLHLINDVLDMAKIESGKMNLLIEKFNLNDTIEDVMSITSSLANEKSIKLFIEPESDQNVFVRADHTRLRQVLINLINNGVKFTEKGSVSVCLKHMGNDVLIAVKDTGLGIPEDHLEAVFSEFTQVDSTTTRKAGGTGLGLPISRRLIEMHGGKLWAESGNGNGIGSTFNILLPIEAVVSEAIVSEPFEKR